MRAVLLDSGDRQDGDRAAGIEDLELLGSEVGPVEFAHPNRSFG
jgi:hypothetical protein